MLRTYAPFGAAVAFCLAISGCASPSNDEPEPPPPEVEEDLSLSVDALDIRHGTLRIEASMTDGSADVSMFLGPECDDKEVGHGIATRSGFAWSLSGSEIARAIECNLVVRAHAIDEDGRRVRRSAVLPVSVGLVDDNTDEVRLLRQEASGSATKMTFSAPSRAARIHIAGSVIGSELDDEDAPSGQFASAFMIDNDDLARAMVGRRHLTILGEDFLATISVGSLTLDVSEPEPEAPVVEVIVPPAVKEEPRRQVESGDWSYDWDYYYGEG
jgi:hypothetical protein